MTTKAYALAAITLASRVLNDSRITATMLDVDLICEARTAANKGAYDRAYSLASAAIAPYLETAACLEARAGIFSVHAAECRA